MEIQDIKTRLPLLQVLSHYQLIPDRNKRLNCPWHDDKTPSLQIYPDTNTWTCFSSNCDAGSGDVIDFMMKYEKLSKHEALLKCKEMIGDVQVSTPPPKRTEQQEESLGRVAVLTRFYHQYIKHKKKFKEIRDAYRYLETRGLEQEALKIGFLPTSAAGHWQKENKIWQQSLKTYGLSRFKGCIMFAMSNIDQQIVGIYGRKISGDGHYYLTGSHQGLYPCWPSVATKRLILTESIIDAASLHSVNNDEVLALYGTKGFTTDHERAIQRLSNLEEVILMLDADEAGEAAIPEVIEKILASAALSVHPNLIISKVTLPTGEDVNSALVKHGKEYLAKQVEGRQILFSSIEIPASPQAGSNEKEKGQLMTTNPELLCWRSDPMLISILGGIKVTGLDKLRVTLKIENSNSEKLPLRESLDLYNSRAVDLLTNRMSDHYQLTHSESQQLISYLTSSLEAYRTKKLELLNNSSEPTVHAMTAQEKQEALEYLTSPKLIERTLRDITKSGIVGEEQNALIGHMIYLSRKRKKPLHVMYLGKSGSGKTYLQEKLAELIPEEDKKNVTALSDQSLYYFGDQLKHKVLLIEDIDGAENVMYSIREFQTKGWVSKTVVWKDPRGNMDNKDIFAQGPVCISSCTTREKVYEDNANRCFLLYIDDSRAQDERIMEYQRKASAGKINPYEQRKIKALHQNVQRLIRPVKVINPFAEYIELPPQVFRPRRSQQLLISFIETVTFYHQHQREVQRNKATGEIYIETSISDIELSFRLLKPVLFTKSDELSQACRRFLERLKLMVLGGESFYTQEIRKQMRLSSSTVHRYIRELKMAGYIQSKGGNRNRGYEYQINDYQEYSQLKSDINQKLEKILVRIKSAKCPSVPQVSHSQNGINKQLVIS